VAVRVRGWEGVAFTVLGPSVVDGPDTWWDGYQVETGQTRVMMMGDDRVFDVDPADILPLDDDAYCDGCGQIGCTAYGS
jgi:hypothetical protein